MKRMILAGLLAAASTSAFAQSTAPNTPTGTVAPGTAVGSTPNSTGGGANVTVAPGATGASTIQTDSAAGGNASQPERRVPQGSGGGSNQ